VSPRRLEEIGVAAAKEHSLEKAMVKMKYEWADLVFEFVPYRDTVSLSVNVSGRDLVFELVPYRDTVSLSVNISGRG